MKVVFLGTSGSMPTPERGSSSVVVRLGRELLMFDCGEGTQRQMVKAHIGFQRPMKIFISHLHGDHVLGLPGLIQSMSLMRREKELHIYGPKGLVAFVKAFSDSLGGPIFPVILYEINEPGVIYDSEEYSVVAVNALHRATAFSYGFFESSRPGRFHPERARRLGVPEGELWGKLQRGEDIEVNSMVVQSSQICDLPRPGRRIIYSGDTAPNEALLELSRGADLLIHEATFLDELSERAAEDGHTTVLQAAQFAADTGVELLVLTHISSRYPDPEVIKSEAVKIFPNVLAAEDFLEIDIPLK
ncbi:ribonuclease Z [Candidatus Bathyarchaeota archaeon]|nr:MAG: ribonuclease Z [Candidatus Bathyarchaeota archaeon]